MTHSTRPGALKSETNSQVTASAENIRTGTNNCVSARFGQINYINSLPLTLPLLSGKSFENVTLGTPSELNQQFFADRLDLGAMSSFFYLENGGFTLIPAMSIASKGPVGSVLFFADRALEELRDGVLAITADSATSVNLLKVLFAETYGFIPRCETSVSPIIDKFHQGALVIGDRALRSDIDWSKELTRVDLGQWWYETFKLPMVFGVWAARKVWVEKNPEAFEHVCTELRQLFDIGLGKQFPEVLKEAEKRTGLSKARLEVYYKRELNFELTSGHLKGLELYKTLCLKHGLLIED